MNIDEREFEEWHEHLYRERNKYKNLLEDILTGVPTVRGMASPYRPMTLEEIRKRVEALLDV